jgi:hypothetical protein
MPASEEPLFPEERALSAKLCANSAVERSTSVIPDFYVTEISNL